MENKEKTWVDYALEHRKKSENLATLAVLAVVGGVLLLSVTVGYLIKLLVK